MILATQVPRLAEVDRREQKYYDDLYEQHGEDWYIYAEVEREMKEE